MIRYTEIAAPLYCAGSYRQRLTAATADFASENGEGAKTVEDIGPTADMGSATLRDSSLAKTFAALLAVEQGELPVDQRAVPASQCYENAGHSDTERLHLTG